MFEPPGLKSGPFHRLFGRLSSFFAKRLGWATVRYAAVSFDQRFAQFNSLNLDLKADTTIRFNRHLVPYISAQTDQQAAYALGCVTEFLRGPQLQFLLRLAQGRLSEMGGSRYVEMDHLIRLLNFGQATQTMLQSMPAETRQWVESFVSGLNKIQAQRRRGLDEKWMGIRPEPYTAEQILLLGRLAGADVNWPLYFSLLECPDDQMALSWWSRLGGQNIATELTTALTSLGRSGSNSMAVSGQRSATGGALLVGDPHLGQHLPNIWMLVGLHSPSYQAVGMMFPGVPVLGMGRNNEVAWGGTNLRAASSDLVQMPVDAPIQHKELTKIKVRWGFSRSREILHSQHGPLLAASKALKPMLRGRNVALKWTGHWPTDEVTAFLSIMRSQNVSEVHQAIGSMGVTPLNIVCADTHGHIQHSLATTLPKRTGFDSGWLLEPEQASSVWAGRLTGHDLPLSRNPVDGFLVSTNNQPLGSELVGFYFNGDERYERACSLLSNLKSIALADLLNVQMDTTSPRAKRLAGQLGVWLAKHPLTDEKGVVIDGCQAVIQALNQWDGNYNESSKACLIFEGLLGELTRLLAKQNPKGAGPLVEEWAYLTNHLIEDLSALPLLVQNEFKTKAVRGAKRFADQWEAWGRVHKVRPRHVLGYVPFLGKLFSAKAISAGGSRETMHKNAHGLLKGYTESAYGSQSRHWHDLSDPDDNHFVLLGGQDGWLGSQLMTDQIELWKLGQSIRMPLTAHRIETEFPHLVKAS